MLPHEKWQNRVNSAKNADNAKTQQQQQQQAATAAATQAATTLPTTISIEATAAATSINQQQSIAQFTSPPPCTYLSALPLPLCGMPQNVARVARVVVAVVSRGKNRFKIYKL